MSSIARTSATGHETFLPLLLDWSSSFQLDKEMVREDLLGSAAHVTMLSRVGLVEEADARKLRDALYTMDLDARAGSLWLPEGEEDVHMAVEKALTDKLGSVAGRLHTARSRNDQVALDLRLHIREQARQALLELHALLEFLITWANDQKSVALPAYTHRQRAQPISAAFMICAWASSLVRAARTVLFALDSCDELPLGSGACSGSSLPIDRTITQELLSFARITTNALDTVGDRDFALDWAYASSRVQLSLSRVAADLVDFATSEFALVRLSGAIATGSSMMPQKKNPDVFELLRGGAAHGIGDLLSLMTLLKGLPTGYNRDLQEDRSTLLRTGKRMRSALVVMTMSLPHVEFNASRGEQALAEGFTQATDLAEALVRKGVPFREAYKAVGELVRRMMEHDRPLSSLHVDEAKAVHTEFDESCLSVLQGIRAVEAKRSLGGTSSFSVDKQLEELAQFAQNLRFSADKVPSLSSMMDTIAHATCAFAPEHTSRTSL